MKRWFKKTSKQLTIRCYSIMNCITQPENRTSYKVISILSGGGFVQVGYSIYYLRPGNLLFIKPEVSLSWDLNQGSVVHYCEIMPAYFSSQPHILKLFQEYSKFNPCSGLIKMSFHQAVTVGMVFKMIRQEASGQHEDKKHAILLHLQMLLLLAKRADNCQDKTFNRRSQLGTCIKVTKEVKLLLILTDSWKNN